MGGRETLALFVRSNIDAGGMNNYLVKAHVPGLLYFVIVELGREWYASDRLPASKWLVRCVGARLP